MHALIAVSFRELQNLPGERPTHIVYQLGGSLAPRGDNDQALVDLALGIAALVADAGVKAEFIRHAMPADFVEDQNAGIAALQE